MFASAAAFLDSDALYLTRCLVCDIEMPQIDGIELLDRLNQAGSRVPALFITAHATERVRERALAAGALCVIEKPIDALELEKWITRALGRE